jgi:hypothetical protein
LFYVMHLGPTPVMESGGLGSTTVRVSLPIRSSNCWGEQRASFSDVVARNDSSLYSSIVAPNKHTQQQQQQHGSQVASTLFADNSVCSSSSSSSSCSNTGSNISRKVSDSTVPASTSAHLGE